MAVLWMDAAIILVHKSIFNLSILVKQGGNFPLVYFLNDLFYLRILYLNDKCIKLLRNQGVACLEMISHCI